MNPLLIGLVPAFLFFQSITASPAQSPAPAAATGKLAWYDKDFQTAQRDAKAQSKILLVFFRADNDPGSDLLTKELFASDDVIEALKDVICLQVDAGKQSALAGLYNAQRTPVIAWFNPDGTARDRFGLLKDLRVYLAAISRIKQDAGTINVLRRQVAAQGGDLEARYDLYTRLKEFGDIQGSSEQKAAILKLDPQGASRGSHHFSYDRITSDIERYWELNNKLPDAKITELQTFIELESFPEIIWDGWMRLANTHDFYAKDCANRGKFADAKDHRVARRACLAKAWRGLPGEPDYLKDWCTNTGDLFWNERDELTPEDKEFLMTMTVRYAAAFPQDGAPYEMRARACFLVGKTVEAIECAEKAVELEPSNKAFQDRLKQLRGG